MAGADYQSIAPPMMLADKQSYELGLLHGAAAEREACARVCEETTAAWTQPVYNAACMDCATAIRDRAERKR